MRINSNPSVSFTQFIAQPQNHRYAQFGELANKFLTPIEGPCPYKWNNETAKPFNDCMAKYTYYNNLKGTTGKIKRILFKITEAVKSIFGCSLWQKASERLATYVLFVNMLDSGHQRALAGINGRYAEFHNLADNVLRYHLGYNPKIDAYAMIDQDKLGFNTFYIGNISRNLGPLSGPDAYPHLISMMRENYCGSSLHKHLSKSCFAQFEARDY